MPQIIDITPVYWKKGFYKEPPRKFSLWGAFILSNLLWLTVVTILATTLMGLARFSSSMTANYLRGEWELSNFRQLTAKELAERDMKIARLISYQSASPTDLLVLANKIAKILDTAPDHQRSFLEKALPEAMYIQIAYGIPASAVLAMSIYESGYGRSTLASQYNNYFGIKAFDDWKGPRAKSMPTRDLGILTTADFRAYHNIREGFMGYANFIRENDRYQRAFRTKSGIQFVSHVLKAGYCPDASYLGNIRTIMERHQLQELDNILETATHTPVQMTGYRE